MFPVKGSLSATPRVASATARGFTLIEMLVVLLIMGLLVGLVSVSAQPDERAVLRLEADRLAQLMNLAASESLLSGKPVAWTAQESAYRFWKFSEDMGWSAMVDDVLRARTLPSGMRMANLRLEHMRSPQQMRVEFGFYGVTDSFSVEMALGGARCTVATSPDGEVRVLPERGAGHENSVRG